MKISTQLLDSFPSELTFFIEKNVLKNFSKITSSSRLSLFWYVSLYLIVWQIGNPERDRKNLVNILLKEGKSMKGIGKCLIISSFIYVRGGREKKLGKRKKRDHHAYILCDFLQVQDLIISHRMENIYI